MIYPLEHRDSRWINRRTALRSSNHIGNPSGTVKSGHLPSALSHMISDFISSLVIRLK
ncbi:MAG TPA: hypothetical protein VGI33_10385 [Paenibacillus sp.]